jgi:alpha-tubulin suppressor-like RCC1 family protein
MTRGVVCWGDSYFDETTHSYQQRVVPLLQNPRMVSAGFDHTCAVDDTGVVCWGGKDRGQSDPPADLLKLPVAVVSAGWYNTCALDAEGIKCWGDNTHKQTEVSPLFFDADHDKVQNRDDAFPFDFDDDGMNDDVDSDDDNDSIADVNDNCPRVSQYRPAGY